MGRVDPEYQIKREEDLRLAAKCKAGDEDAKAQLFRTHGPQIYRLIRRFLQNSSDAEDLLQQVFLDALLGIRNYRGEAPLISWLRTITIRAVFRHLKQKRPTISLELVKEEYTENKIESQLESRARLRRLFSLLEKLTIKRRVVFVLHEVEGFSLPEVAAILGISTTAAKKRVWQARRHLERLSSQDPYLKHFMAKQQEKDV